MELQQLYSQDDVAERLGCWARTLERYRVGGDGPLSSKSGGSFDIEPAILMHGWQAGCGKTRANRRNECGRDRRGPRRRASLWCVVALPMSRA
jgi:hypothetical protein